MATLYKFSLAVARSNELPISKHFGESGKCTSTITTYHSTTGIVLTTQVVYVPEIKHTDRSIRANRSKQVSPTTSSSECNIMNLLEQ